MTLQTREPQYQFTVDLSNREGRTHLGLTVNQMWHDDPRHLLFTLSRYKFAAKMLSEMNSVLEIGCGDAFGSRLVLQEVSSLTAIDFDPVFIADAKSRMDDNWRYTCFVHDILDGPLPGQFDAAYSLDVIEHIPPVMEDLFLTNIALSLKPNGVFLVGSPSLESQIYASEPSRQGHVNCMSQRKLKFSLLKHFSNVFMFSMNDEVVHSGFGPMSHYLFGVAVNPRYQPR